MKKMIACTAQAALAATAMLLAQSALAEEFIQGGQETFTLNLGGIVNQFDTSLRLDGAVSKGTQINLEGNGLSENLTSFMAGASPSAIASMPCTSASIAVAAVSPTTTSR